MLEKTPRPHNKIKKQKEAKVGDKVGYVNIIVNGK
jgi:hypothetical protein